MQEYRFDEYQPTEDEVYMCRNHREYFKQKLLVRRQQLLAMSKLFLVELKENGIKAADILDQSSRHTEMFIDFPPANGSRRSCTISTLPWSG